MPVTGVVAQLRTADMAASIRFYTEILGLDVAFNYEDFYVGIRAAAAGAAIVKSAHDTFRGGYSGYFQDPDGHLWEGVWNSRWVE